MERRNYYFKTNDISDGGKKQNISLTVCESKIYGMIRNQLSPKKPHSKSFQELAKLVEEHLNPKASVVVRHFKFYNNVRQHSQSVSDFILTLLEECEFGDTMKTMLRDRLVCGIADTDIQKMLLQDELQKGF